MSLIFTHSHRQGLLSHLTHCILHVHAQTYAGMCVCVCVCGSECVSSRPDSTEGEDIPLVPQGNNTIAQECLICNDILLHTNTQEKECVCGCSSACVSVVFQVCVFVSEVCIHVCVCDSP